MDYAEFIDSLRCACCAAWSSFLLAYVQPGATAERQAALQLKAKADLLDRRVRGDAAEVAKRAGTWAAAWRESAATAGEVDGSGKCEALEAAVSLELEQKALALVIDLVSGLGLAVAGPLFGPHTPAIAWLARHMHFREMRDEDTPPADTFVNDCVVRVLGMPAFGAA